MLRSCNQIVRVSVALKQTLQFATRSSTFIPYHIASLSTKATSKVMDNLEKKLDTSPSAVADGASEPPREASATEAPPESSAGGGEASAAGSGTATPAKKWTLKIGAPRIVPSPSVRRSINSGPVGNRIQALRRAAGTPLPSPRVPAVEAEPLGSDEEELIQEVKEMQELTESMHLPQDIPPIPGRKKRFAIIYCEDDPKWSDELPRIWTRLLRQPGEEWVLYRLAEKGELPAITEEDDWDGFLIPGSGHSAYEDLPWIHRLKELIRQCFIPYLSNHNDEEHRLKPQIVGSCFGAQVIAEALGGHVTKNPRGKYCVKAEEIYIQESFVRQPFAEGIIFKTKYGPRFQPKRPRKRGGTTSTNSTILPLGEDALPFIRVTETHGDSVLTLPGDSQVLGSSKTITNEVFMVGKNMLAYQSHPEFTYKKHLMKKILPYVLPERMDPSDLEDAKKSFQQELHSHALIEVTRRFLKREYRDTYAMYHSGSLSETLGSQEHPIDNMISDLNEAGLTGSSSPVPF